MEAIRPQQTLRVKGSPEIVVVYQKKDLLPVHTKTEALPVIGLYLHCSKDTVKRTTDFAYDTPGGSTYVSNHDSEWEAGDLLELFRLFKILRAASEGREDDNASLTTLGSFNKDDTHYTYTVLEGTNEITTDGGDSVTNTDNGCNEDVHSLELDVG